jgi:hypothetical protein
VVVAATAVHEDPVHRTVAEGLAGIDAIAAGRASASRLVRDVVAAIYDEDEPDHDPPVDGNLLAACRTAVRLLDERVGRLDADAYRNWLVAIATRVCHAARTGGLLGVAGAVVSPAERRFLAELTEALGG